MAPTSTPQQTTDPLPGLVGFTVVLRHAGLAITTDRVAASLSALDTGDGTARTQTYWAGRLTLCSGPAGLPRYGQAFASWFEPGQGGRTQVRDVRPAPPPRLAALTPEDAEGGEEASDARQLHAKASGT